MNLNDKQLNSYFIRRFKHKFSIFKPIKMFEFKVPKLIILRITCGKRVNFDMDTLRKSKCLMVNIR